MPPTPPITIICARCTGRDVSRDAWADWDDATQQWVLRAVFDYAWCHTCDEEARVDETPLVSHHE